jgi:hypothetical protein
MYEITEEYLLLFNAVTDAENTLLRLREDLVAAQRRAEELYINRGAGASAPKRKIDEPA